MTRRDIVEECIEIVKTIGVFGLPEETVELIRVAFVDALQSHHDSLPKDIEESELKRLEVLCVNVMAKRSKAEEECVSLRKENKLLHAEIIEMRDKWAEKATKDLQASIRMIK